MNERENLTVDFVPERHVAPETFRSEGGLQLAGGLFAVGSAVHLFDHLRRGQTSVTDELYWAGNVGVIVQVAVITLILTAHRLAPIAAVSAGFPLALGFFAAHWLPEWSALSDPVWEIESLPLLSYVASVLEIAGAVAIAVVGLQIVRNRGLEHFDVGAPAT